MSTRTIERVTAWLVHLPYSEGVYRMSGDRITTGMDTLVVRLVADDGTVGIGESGTTGVTYDAAYPGGQRAGLLVELHARGAQPQVYRPRLGSR